jgi:hypothetical protein
MTTLFIVLLSAGVIYAIFILIGGEMGHMHLPFHFHIGPTHVDTSGEGGLPGISPITIASFVTAFGAFGLIMQWLTDGSPTLSMGGAVIGAIIVALLAHFAFGYFLLAPQGSSAVTMNDVVGTVAEVVTPIPSDSVGEVALVAQGGRLTFPAKSSAGIAIKRNTTVVVDRVVGGIAFVSPQIL